MAQDELFHKLERLEEQTKLVLQSRFQQVRGIIQNDFELLDLTDEVVEDWRVKCKILYKMLPEEFKYSFVSVCKEINELLKKELKKKKSIVKELGNTMRGIAD